MYKFTTQFTEKKTYNNNKQVSLTDSQKYRPWNPYKQGPSQRLCKDPPHTLHEDQVHGPILILVVNSLSHPPHNLLPLLHIPINRMIHLYELEYVQNWNQRNANLVFKKKKNVQTWWQWSCTLNANCQNQINMWAYIPNI